MKFHQGNSVEIQLKTVAQELATLKVKVNEWKEAEENRGSGDVASSQPTVSNDGKGTSEEERQNFKPAQDNWAQVKKQ